MVIKGHPRGTLNILQQFIEIGQIDISRRSVVTDDRLMLSSLHHFHLQHEGLDQSTLMMCFYIRLQTDYMVSSRKSGSASMSDCMMGIFWCLEKDSGRQQAVGVNASLPFNIRNILLEPTENKELRWKFNVPPCRREYCVNWFVYADRANHGGSKLHINRLNRIKP